MAHVLEGFSYVWRHRRMKTLLLLFAIVGIFGWSYSVLMPAFASGRAASRAARGYGALLSANGIGALVGALTVASVGHRVTGGCWCLAGCGFFQRCCCCWRSRKIFTWRWSLLAIGGWGMLLFFSTTNTLIQTSVSDGMRGRVMGIWALVFGGMMPVGGLEAGSLSHWLGVRWTVAIGALFARSRRW